MKANQIIPFSKTERIMRDLEKGEYCLTISEFFSDTIQGEGIHVGHPATFLRLKGCTMKCDFCDTAEVWSHGSYYSVKEVLHLIEEHGLVEKFRNGQHLVFTGGSPLLHQKALLNLIQGFRKRHAFVPFIEVENECVIIPDEAFAFYVSCWNNSPKLSNSGVRLEWRYQREVIHKTARLSSSWFKFVVSTEEDWSEIESLFLVPELIEKAQILLMPKGETRAELTANQEAVVEMAVRHGVRYTTREHIILWDKTVGI